MAKFSLILEFHKVPAQAFDGKKYTLGKLNVHVPTISPKPEWLIKADVFFRNITMIDGEWNVKRSNFIDKMLKEFVEEVYRLLPDYDRT